MHTAAWHISAADVQIATAIMLGIFALIFGGTWAAHMGKSLAGIIAGPGIIVTTLFVLGAAAFGCGIGEWNAYCNLPSTPESRREEVVKKIEKINDPEMVKVLFTHYQQALSEPEPAPPPKPAGRQPSLILGLGLFFGGLATIISSIVAACHYNIIHD
jgi:hypothetical protein